MDFVRIKIEGCLRRINDKPNSSPAICVDINGGDRIGKDISQLPPTCDISTTEKVVILHTNIRGNMDTLTTGGKTKKVKDILISCTEISCRFHKYNPNNPNL